MKRTIEVDTPEMEAVLTALRDDPVLLGCIAEDALRYAEMPERDYDPLYVADVRVLERLANEAGKAAL